jgi:signal transduction histidine kinase
MSRDRLDEAPIPAIALRDDVVTYANRAAGALLGAEPAALVGQPAARVLPAEARDALRVPAGGAAPRTLALAVFAAGGRRIEVEASAFAHGGETVVLLRDAGTPGEFAARRADLEARDAELAARNRLVELAATAPDLPEFFARGLEVVRELAGCRGVGVWLLDEARGELVLHRSLGVTPQADAAHARVPLDAAGTASVVRSGAPSVFPVDAFREPTRSMVAAAGFDTVASVPLRVRARVVGVMNAGFGGPPDAAAARLPLLVKLAGPFAAAVETQRLFDDLRRSYAELERAQRKLVQRERLAAIGELSAVIAHEVRNPLAVVFNSLGSLQRILRPQGDVRLLLDVIQEEADRLNRTVGDLLDFARPSEPSPRPEPLERLVEEALGAAVAQPPEGLAVRREHDPALPAVPVDGRQLRQALVNLLVNAVQAMPRGGTLSVRTARDGAHVRLEVCDTGPGVPEGMRQRVFEPFYSTKATGTGLGLAVVRRIAESHGGSAEVLDAPGGGARFVLRLPLEPAPPVEIGGGIRSDRPG